MDLKLQPEFYDNFRCIADRCPMTCCRGWDISVDADTCNRWEAKEGRTRHFLENIRTGKHGRKSECFLKMNAEKGCPYLTDQGLCSIVIKHGENYQPKTCRIFPRLESESDNLTQHSLSCACPAVVDIINGIPETIKFLLSGGTQDNNNQDNIIPNGVLSGYKVREAMINLVQNRKILFRDRLLLTFHMLLVLKVGKASREDIVNRYQSEEYLTSIIKLWSGVDIRQEDSYREVNELFIDIVWNYRKEKAYNKYLQGLYATAESQHPEDYLNLRKSFSQMLSQYEPLMEKCLVSKIFANCSSNKAEDIIMAFQLAITQYLMVRHALFLKWLSGSSGNINSDNQTDRFDSPVKLENNRLEYSDLRDYIVIFTRIIEYNTEGIREFWEESFDEAIWELGYLLLLINE